MSFDWLNKFHNNMQKPDNYAEKTLAAYKLGMRSRGSIAGVRVETTPHSCAASSEIEKTAVFHPADAPRLPLPTCEHGKSCPCVYRPVMTYEVHDDDPPVQ